MNSIHELEKSIGHTFNNISYLHTALTHSSYINEEHMSGIVCNERLEFLGDSVLSLAVSTYIYKNYPDYPEGELSKIRAAVVCETSLAKVAERINLGEYLKLSHGEMLSGGNKKPSVLSDAVESVIAAMCLDAGFETAEKFVLKYLTHSIEEAAIYGGDDEDYKSRLQEYAQSVGKSVIYEIVSQSGPAHNANFTACVQLNSKKANGTGTSKKKAEQQAAKNMLDKIKK